jgi:hypothetical protein
MRGVMYRCDWRETNQVQKRQASQQRGRADQRTLLRYGCRLGDSDAACSHETSLEDMSGPWEETSDCGGQRAQTGHHPPAADLYLGACVIAGARRLATIQGPYVEAGLRTCERFDCVAFPRQEPDRLQEPGRCLCAVAR